MTDASVAAPASPIEVMHQQWELAWDANDINDEAMSAARTEQGDKYRHERAYNETATQARLLSFAILYQMPVTFRDAAILQFHIQMLVDQCEPSVYREQDYDALKVATSQLFDFIVGELLDTPTKIGRAFDDTAEFCMADRQARTARRDAE